MKTNEELFDSWWFRNFPKDGDQEFRKAMARSNPEYSKRKLDFIAACEIKDKEIEKLKEQVGELKNDLEFTIGMLDEEFLTSSMQLMMYEIKQRHFKEEE